MKKDIDTHRDSKALKAWAKNYIFEFILVNNQLIQAEELMALLKKEYDF